MTFWETTGYGVVLGAVLSTVAQLLTQWLDRNRSMADRVHDRQSQLVDRVLSQLAVVGGAVSRHNWLLDRAMLRYDPEAELDEQERILGEFLEQRFKVSNELHTLRSLSVGLCDKEARQAVSEATELAVKATLLLETVSPDRMDALRSLGESALAAVARAVREVGRVARGDSSSE